MGLDLLGLGSAASGLGSLAGGFFGAKQAKKSNKLAMRQFNAQMDQSIQRRVKDAQAAGIHPLFALGASVGASPTLHAGQSDTGSMIGEAIAGAGRAATNYAASKGLQRVQAAQIRSAEASATRDEAEAQLALSRAKTIEQEFTSRGHDGFSGEAKLYPYGEKPASHGLVFGPAKHVAPEVPYSQSMGVRAGNIPERIRVVGRDGRAIDVINPELEFEFLPELLWARQKAQYWTTDQMTKFEQWMKRNGIRFHRR